MFCSLQAMLLRSISTGVGVLGTTEGREERVEWIVEEDREEREKGIGLREVK